MVGQTPTANDGVVGDHTTTNVYITMLKKWLLEESGTFELKEGLREKR